MEGDCDVLAEPVDGPVYVRAHGESTWVVYMGAELLLVTDDGEEALQAGCKASGQGVERPLILQSGPSWRPSEALLSQIEKLLAPRDRIGDRRSRANENVSSRG